MNYGQNTQDTQNKPVIDSKSVFTTSEKASEPKESQLSAPDLNSEQFLEPANPGSIGNIALENTGASRAKAQEIPDSMMPNKTQRPEKIPDLSHNPVFDPEQEDKKKTDKESLGQIIDLKTPQFNEQSSTSESGQNSTQAKPEQTKVARLKEQIDDFMHNPEPDIVDFYETMQNEREQDVSEGAS